MYDDGLLLVSGGFNLIPLTAALRYPVAHSVVDGTLWGRGGGASARHAIIKLPLKILLSK